MNEGESEGPPCVTPEAPIGPAPDTLNQCVMAESETEWMELIAGGPALKGFVCLAKCRVKHFYVSAFETIVRKLIYASYPSSAVCIILCNIPSEPLVRKL